MYARPLIAGPRISTTQPFAIVAGPHEPTWNAKTLPKLLAGLSPSWYAWTVAGTHAFGPRPTYCVAASMSPAGGSPIGGATSGLVGQPTMPPGKLTTCEARVSPGACKA